MLVWTNPLQLAMELGVLPSSSTTDHDQPPLNLPFELGHTGTACLNESGSLIMAIAASYCWLTWAITLIINQVDR